MSDSSKINNECQNQINMLDIMREPIRITKPIRLIELFAGYGSQAMALRDIGAQFEHYRAVELDKYAIKSYNAVHGTEFAQMDITQIHAEDLSICDTEKYCYLMTYSFPCTDLSLAGKKAGMKRGSGTRSGLLWEVERILREIKESGGELPQILFMENVPQVHNNTNVDDFKKWMDFLSGLGYVNYWKDLNAKDYGVAQNRNRCFMFSFLGEYKYHFPRPIPLEKKIKDYLEDEVDEKYYVSDVALKGFEEHAKKQKEKGNSFHAVFKDTYEVASTIKSRYYKDGSDCLIKTNIAGKIRRLTPKECGRLMDVTDSDIDKMAAVNSNTQLYKQFGNSIVKAVMCEMFKNLNIT